MFRRALAFAGLIVLAGCAQEVGSRPSYIGLSDLPRSPVDAASAAEPAKEPSASLRHVQSNKVLGAMAFQKVTGRSVDPASLSGRE